MAAPFVEEGEKQRDVSALVHVLCDTSSSVLHNGIAEPIAAALNGVLSELQKVEGVDASAALFDDHYRVALKEGQSWRRQSQRALHAVLSPSGSNTLLPQSMVISAAQMAASRKRRKLMVVITDGAFRDDEVKAIHRTAEGLGRYIEKMAVIHVVGEHFSTEIPDHSISKTFVAKIGEENAVPAALAAALRWFAITR